MISLILIWIASKKKLAVMCKYLRHADSKGRDELLFEPRIALEPWIIARAGMRKRYYVRPVLLPCANGLG